MERDLSDRDETNQILQLKSNYTLYVSCSKNLTLTYVEENQIYVSKKKFILKSVPKQLTMSCDALAKRVLVHILLVQYEKN